MVLGLQAGGREGAVEPLLEQLGDVLAEMADEHELAVADFARDAGEHLVVLRQILEQRLRAPIGRRIRHAAPVPRGSPPPARSSSGS